MIGISACLLGENCRYDGGHNSVRAALDQLMEEGEIVSICPEVLGGLPTPRPPAEIVGGNGDDVLDGVAKVMDVQGNGVTEPFVQGAYMALERVQQAGITTVVLKENSPSCGSSAIYDGTFSRGKIVGFGVTTALLRRHGVRVISEHQLSELVQR
ncbi:DUF523 domain-containing protein [Priestia taiwanensis]|uniref:DUF523 domain-containing protein n=1 Tax=Priestia taiwanensis TaxID=1347902 RepID=A0A917AJ52_9BACI|nr:DUF523 domain-containing protein [Priestia taiwanensis]MBM7361661.1 uncharacterized protein YbbK (DUF523 family) [Priestia taiwanensis]GGE55981.1 hypothetical protein GCM10007140_02860 [Priestia taiwanensis]